MERLILFPSIWSTMVKTTSIASQDISMQSKCLVNQKKKINRKKKKSSAQYYSNYIATYRITLSGDTEWNPATGLSKPKCRVCDKTVRCNQKLIVCEQSWNVSCQILQSSTEPKYSKWSVWNGHLNCIDTALPFFDRRNLDFDSTVAYKTTILHTNNCHIETLKNYQKYTSITHINCQSILSTFDEFVLCCNPTNPI